MDRGRRVPVLLVRPVRLVRLVLLVLLVLAGSVVLPESAGAQDQAQMARIYGTRLPEGYWEFARREPQLFEFARALKAVGERAAAPRRAAPGARVGGAAVQALAQGAPLTGTYRVPAVIGLFAGVVPSPVSAEALERELFTGPNSYYKTVTEYYHDMSDGRFTVTGTVFDTVRSTLTLQQAMGTDGCISNFNCRLGDYIRELVAALDAQGIDWGVFDNDGPDGIPNSGDDDGYVDLLAVFHPLVGMECGGTGPWARKTRLSALPQNPGAFETSTPSNRPGGGNIRIDDLVIQSAVSCIAGRGVTEIGVFTHEFGHALGLPDLYDTVPFDGSDSQGIGRWGLMGSGSWGCSGALQPERPCGMSAWSREQLGWVDVEWIPADEAPRMLSLGAVAETRRAYRIDSGDGAREYYLLESRQPVGFDQAIPGAGLLVWHIDQDVVDAGWPFNQVNTNPARYGVGLVEADGQGNLRRNQGQGDNYGDAGDPFPGSRQNRVFHAGSEPASLTNQGWATGLTLRDITYAGGESRFELSTRFNTLSLDVEGLGSARVTIDGRREVTLPAALPWAPFEARTLLAEPGQDTGNGVRTGFAGWSDGAPRERPFSLEFEDAALTVRYDKQFRLNTAVQGPGPGPGVAPGTVVLSPAGTDGGWYAPGTSLEATASAATGFAFERWDGAAQGTANPVVLTMDTARSLIAVFRQSFAAEAPAIAQFDAADSVVLELNAVDGTPPFNWSLISGTLPAGLQLRLEGRIIGAALETGSFPLRVQVRDAIGLTAALDLTLQVTQPTLALEALLAPLLGTAGGPTAVQRQFLDRYGNGNGSYDVGDLRAYLAANPNLPMTTADRAVVRILVPEVVLPERRQ